MFSGDSAQYRLEASGVGTVVSDSVDGRDGIDELTGIEVVVFRDKKVAIQ